MADKSIKDEKDGTGLYKKYADIGTDADGNTLHAEVVSASVSVGTVGLDAGVNSIGTVGLNTGANTIGKVDLNASELHIGQVGGDGITIAQTPTITVGAYSAGDAVGGLLTFANAARVAGTGGLLSDVVVIDDAGQQAELELWLFNQTFTAMADNAAWNPSETDLENLICVIDMSSDSWYNATTQYVLNKEVVRYLTLVGTSLFGQLVCRDTPTFAAVDDVTVKVKIVQD